MCTTMKLRLVKVHCTDHSFHDMGEEKDGAIVSDPLGLTWPGELVYDALCHGEEILKGHWDCP